jgi:hypothetical protein
MNYLYLIKQLFNYANYVKYRHHIKIDKDQREVYYLFKALDQLMEKFQKDISFEDYALWVQVNLGNDYVTFLQLIKESNQDDTILEASLNEIQTRSILYELASAALAGSEGKKTVEEVLHIVEQLAQKGKTSESVSYVSTSLEELYDDAYKHHGLRWRLDSLNKSLGSLRRGDFGFIFARPESGKTTFLASECSYFAEQLETDSPPGIWFNNEEQHNKVMLRIYQASLGITIGELAKDIKGYEQLYKEKTKDKILIPNLDIIHRKEVEAILRDVRPSFIIFDQLSKIKGFTNDRDDLRLGATFEWARELAKEYAPVIGVNQADASGEGKKYLNMDNVAGAKTAIQAEADWILGIGKTNDAGFEYIRHFNICKNKLIGDEDTDPSRRHGKIDCLIQADIARYRDL